MGAACIIAAALLSASQPAFAQHFDPQALCADRAIVDQFRTLVRDWSLRQNFLLDRTDEGDRTRLYQWKAEKMHSSLTQPGFEQGWIKSGKQERYACEADFNYASLTMAAFNDPSQRFTISNIAYVVTYDKAAGGALSVSIENLPEAINTDAALLSIQDRMTIAGKSVRDWIEISKRPRPIATPPRKPPTPEEIEGLMRAELERQMREGGMGHLVDAENARRAKMTPAQRAEEDTWVRGPARGETMCRQENGITRCKTGR